MPNLNNHNYLNQSHYNTNNKIKQGLLHFFTLKHILLLGSDIIKKVLLICGGLSEEREISILSAKSIIDNIDTSKFVIRTVVITKNNEWLENNKPIDNILKYLKSFDIVFPITHGQYGEDGKLQGLLDFLGIKYVGSKCCSSAICMDKIYSKIVFNSLNIPIIPYQTADETLNLVYPVIVKPANSGSSYGITKVNNESELNKAINMAKQYDNKVLIEKFIDAKELECAILENNTSLISEIGEIKSINEFYDYEAKYNKQSIITIPADISDSLKSEITNIAKKVFKALNLENFARIDFLYDIENQQIYLNEINTIPGFTKTSMYPQLIINKGYSYKELITILLENAK